MKRSMCVLLAATLLAACSPKKPSKSPTPLPTVEVSQTAAPAASATATSAVTALPRITILPSATPLWTAVPTNQETGESEGAPAETGVSTPSAAPVATVTPRTVDAGPTATPRPTATFSDSPLPTSPLESPLAVPTETPSPDTSLTPTPTSAPQPESSTATPTASAGATPSATASPGPSATPESQEPSWRFEKMFTYYDDVFQEFYVMGELVNDTESYWRVTTFWPVILDTDGNYLTTKDDADATGSGYKNLREAISLGPGASLPFSFLVFVPDGVVVEDNYDFVIEAEIADPLREDLDISSDDFDDSDWPLYFYVNGTFENPGPDLTEYVALMVTVYDMDEQVIGVGWLYDTNPAMFSTGTHNFGVEVELWEIVDFLELDVYSYKIQIFGR